MVATDAVPEASRGRVALPSDSQTSQDGHEQARCARSSSWRCPRTWPASFSVADRPGSSTIGSTAAIASATMRAIDGIEQRRLGVEVVVEGAARRVQLVEQVLDAHLLVALGLDEPLGSVDERVAPNGVPDRVDRPSHRVPALLDIHRPTVGLMILLRSMEGWLWSDRRSCRPMSCDRPLTGRRRYPA